MIKDGSFLTDDITSDNIAKISAKQSVTEEARICELAELADSAAEYAFELFDEGYDVYAILSLISEAINAEYTEVHSFALAENVTSLTSYLKKLCELDRVIFAELLAYKIRARGIKVSESDFLPSFSGDETFTYVRNPLADEAYDVFTQDFINARVKYSSSLSEAAHSVAQGEFEYALLPLEERGGARLAAVAALLFKEELKINSVTPVFGSEGMADMKYALVSKHFSVPEFREDDDRYLEIRLRADLSISLAELFSAADALGVSLYRVNTISFDTEDGAITHYSLVFRDEGKDFTALLVYLTLFSGAYTTVGIYKNLE